MWRAVVLGGVCLVVLVAAFLDFYDPHPPGWELTSAERANIDAGGWKDALEPLKTIPIEPKQAAEEVAARLAVEYCSKSETARLEEHNTDNDYITYVPACFHIEEPRSRLETPDALIEVSIFKAGPPIIEFNGVREHQCLVNAGARYEGEGTCIRDLLSPDS
jgi:hypothetical protein